MPFVYNKGMFSDLLGCFLNPKTLHDEEKCRKMLDDNFFHFYTLIVKESLYQIFVTSSSGRGHN